MCAWQVRAVLRWGGLALCGAASACETGSEPHGEGASGGGGNVVAGVGGTAGGVAQAGRSAGGTAAGGAAPGTTVGGAPNGGAGSPGQALPDAATLAKAAVILGSCMPDDGINRNALYLWTAGQSPRFWHHFAPAADCLARAGQGCGALETCLGWRVEAEASRCEWTCSGSVFSGCGDGFRLIVDCATLGMACDPYAVCSAGPSQPCTQETFERSCTSEGEPEFCDDRAVFRGPNCARLGLVCVEGYCVGSGETCSGEPPDDQGGVYFDGVSCEGSELFACVGGRAARRDCVAMASELDCQQVAGEPFCGLASECLPALDASRYGNFQSRCEGNEAVLCNAGRIERIDCISLGFTGCDESAQGCVPGLLP